jgi:hypothetical protein
MIKHVKQNDTKPFVKAVLSEVTGSPPQASAVNLTGATVKFIMRLSGSSTAKVATTATISTAASGIVRYEWVAADTDTLGNYIGEFEVTDSGGNIETFWDLRTAQEMIDEMPPEILTIRIVDDFG